MDHIGSILPGVLRKRGLHGPALAAHVLLEANRWLSAALPHFSGSLHAMRYSDGVLTVCGDHPIALQECQPLLASLSEHLEKHCKANVREIRLDRSGKRLLQKP